jgi:hypothetical protein
MPESVKIPLSLAAPGITRFLTHIRNAGVPNKVNGPYLQAASFRNSNDTALITIFKLLGFIDKSGVPTDLWRQYRGDAAQAREVLGRAVKNAYAGLFALYPDAPNRTDETISNWIRANTTYGGDSVERAIRTFRTLCAEATFEDSEQDNAADSEPEAPRPTKSPEEQLIAQPTVPASVKHFTRPGITINIELQIPPTDDPTVYENFFAAMRKHLFDGD